MKNKRACDILRFIIIKSNKIESDMFIILKISLKIQLTKNSRDC